MVSHWLGIPSCPVRPEDWSSPTGKKLLIRSFPILPLTIPPRPLDRSNQSCTSIQSLAFGSPRKIKHLIIEQSENARIEIESHAPNLSESTQRSDFSFSNQKRKKKKNLKNKNLCFQILLQMPLLYLIETKAEPYYPPTV